MKRNLFLPAIAFSFVSSLLFTSCCGRGCLVKTNTSPVPVSATALPSDGNNTNQ